MTDFLIRHFIKNGSDVKNSQVREQYGRLAGIVGMLCNALLSAGKILTGTLFGSLGILADGVNNLSDAASSAVTLIGFKLASKPADEEHPFGHARFEYVAGLVISFFILLLGFDLAKSAVGKILHPEETVFSYLSVAVLAVSILVKLWMSAFNRTLGRRIDSTTIAAAAQDSLNDVFVTGSVLFCTLLSRFAHLNIDGYIGLAVAVFILVSGVKLIGETISPLLGEAPDEELVEETCRRLKSYDKVLGIHDLVVHNYGPGRCFASVHVEMDAKNDVMVSHDITDRIERDFLKDGLHLVVHLDPIVTDDAEINEMRSATDALVRRIDPRLTIHDFRMVRGPYHTNLIFDVVVPADYPEDDGALRARIQDEVKKIDENYFTVVNVDRCYVGLH